ncbi:MAG TPA: polysaccharide lyase family protein [Opitutales bacterium]|nr:polysaccharide lyase family protein [Opitutales bacterium]
MNWRVCLGSFLIFASPAALAADDPTPAPVTVQQTDQLIDFNNGFVAFTLNKANGVIYSLRPNLNGKFLNVLNENRPAMVFDYDSGITVNGRKAHVSFGSGASHATARLVNSSPESAEMAVAYDPTPDCPFNVEAHYILHRGDHGLYFYLTYAHGPGMLATIMEQTRVVVWTLRGTDTFTNYVVDDARKGPYPAGEVLATPMDTSWLYAFDNQVHSKYDYANFIADDLIHGIAGHGVGLWLIQPGREYVSGGPLRQELTTHQDSPQTLPQNNVVLWMLQGNHFGGADIPIAADEKWTRFYGPAFLYFNSGDTVDAMWTDAKKVAAAEDAKWPYNFIKNDDYPLDRGTVTGQIKVSSGDSAKGAWVVLAYPGDPDWCMSVKGYQFWTKADADGKFTISKVRPGNYSLHVTGGNQFEDYVQDNLTVKAGANNLGTLNWTAITHGQKLWQIGQPDRSSQEFKEGLNYRHFTNYIRYGTDFPNDVTYTVGQSKDNQDWGFAQWGWYMKQPYWSVKFAESKAQTGLATLTLSFAAWDYPRPLDVLLNGQVIAKVSNLKKSGMAIYRSGGQDSLRQTVYLPFDASLIHAGANEMQFALEGARPYDPPSATSPQAVNGIMWDALRLEVDANGKAP